MNLQESRIFTLSLTFLIPFDIFKVEFWQIYILRIFKPCLVQWHFFLTCKNIEEIVFEAILQQMLTQDIPESENNTENCCWYIWHQLTNSNFLLYLIGYFWDWDIKLKNSMKKKIAKKRVSALWNMQNIREKQKQKYVSKCISPCLQGIRMRRSTKKKNGKQMYDQIKRRYNGRRKLNSLLFLNFVKKKF